GRPSPGYGRPLPGPGLESCFFCPLRYPQVKNHRHAPPLDRSMTIQVSVLDEELGGRSALRPGDLPRLLRGWFAPGGAFAWDRLSLALFLLAGLIILATFRSYGVTWDEDVHNWYGVFVLDYYTS